MLPAVNFDASTFAELLGWDGVLFTEPPLNMTLSDEGLDGIRYISHQYRDTCDLWIFLT